MTNYGAFSRLYATCQNCFLTASLMCALWFETSRLFLKMRHDSPLGTLNFHLLFPSLSPVFSSFDSGCPPNSWKESQTYGIICCLTTPSPANKVCCSFLCTHRLSAFTVTINELSLKMQKCHWLNSALWFLLVYKVLKKVLQFLPACLADESARVAFDDISPMWETFSRSTIPD